MAFPLLTLVPGLLRTVAKFAGGDILGKAADTLENLAIPPEKQAEMALALQKHEEAMKQLSLEEMKTVLSESLAMVQSTDKYVARARPTGLYAAYLFTGAMIVAVIFQLPLDHALVAELVLPLYGAQGYYMHLRTREKLNGV